MQRDNDIRFDRRPVPLEHESARGEVVRNVGAFTRGSQLIRLRYMMMLEGLRWPILAALTSFIVLLVLLLALAMQEHEVQLVEMHVFVSFWSLVGLDPDHWVNLTLTDGSLEPMPIGDVSSFPEVARAWTKFVRCIIVAFAGSLCVSGPVATWFVRLSQQIGVDILRERHERGAMLVATDVLVREINAHNAAEMASELAVSHPAVDPKKVAALSVAERATLGIHVPYTMASISYPWRLEQTHAMLIGTTGTGKTTQLRKMVLEARERGHRCVIFDLTGAFVEAFYDEARDHILNPMDLRCPPWTIFNDCTLEADFIAAAAALIPGEGANSEPFWSMAARTLFSSMCIKLAAIGETTNGAIVHHLMAADLKTVHAHLLNTVAAPLTALESARMAESIRSVFNTQAQALRFLPDPVPGGLPPFSIRRWVQDNPVPGSILFITSTHSDLVLNRSLLTLWMDLAVEALMGMPRTRDLRMWYLFDEVHALHRLPAIEHGLQTARAHGGALVLGMHSFDKLAETYGKEGAINLASLARTKLILGTADETTAKFCSGFIGSREVRETDEAYSIGATRSRDAATITPRTEVKPLVMPDDLMNLPSFHGYVKFPEGFPAARIRLEWRDYPIVAEPYQRTPTMRIATYVPPTAPVETEAAEGGPAPKLPEPEKPDRLPVLSRRDELERSPELPFGDPVHGAVPDTTGVGAKPPKVDAAGPGRQSNVLSLLTSTEARRAMGQGGGSASKMSSEEIDRLTALGLAPAPSREQQIAIEERTGQAFSDPGEKASQHTREGPDLSTGRRDDMDMGL